MDVINRLLSAMQIGHIINQTDKDAISEALISVRKDTPVRMTNGVCPACGQRRIDTKFCPYCGQALMEAEVTDPDDWQKYTE